MAKKTTRALVTSGANAIDPNQLGEELQLYAPSGAAASVIIKQAAQADSTATDVTGLKSDFNALLAKLRSGGILG